MHLPGEFEVVHRDVFGVEDARNRLSHVVDTHRIRDDVDIVDRGFPHTVPSDGGRITVSPGRTPISDPRSLFGQVTRDAVSPGSAKAVAIRRFIRV